MACCTSPATAAQHSWRDNCYHGASCAKQVIMYRLQDAEFRQSSAQHYWAVPQARGISSPSIFIMMNGVI